MFWMIAVMATISMVCGVVAVQHWRHTQTPWWEGLGLRLDRWTWLDLAIGILISALVMVGIFVAEWSMGALKVEGFRPVGMDFWTELVKRAASAFQEELLFRSLMLSGLVLMLRRRWLALGVMAVLFGVAHATNPNASALSVAGNALDGLLYGVAFLWSGCIWLPLGLHFAWNFFQGPVLGFPVSGFDMGGLVQQHAVGNDLLTGGSYGPEAGIIGRVAWLVAFALVLAWLAMRQRFRPVPEHSPKDVLPS
jgi:membrane protease YdiL (CAAX protease family)